jgi:2'-5' RNA ligase
MLARVFLAAWLGPVNQSYYADFVAALRSRAVRPVPAGSVHLTLAFLPEVTSDQLETLTDVVESVARKVRPFDIGLGSARILWSRRDPRLIEVPVVVGAASYEDLATALAAAIRRELPGVPSSPSKAPHATIARFRKHARPDDAEAIAGALTTPERSDRIEEIAVVVSTLTPEGPRYELAAQVRLAAAE